MVAGPPPFLQHPESEWPEPPCTFPELPDEFKVLKRTSVAVTKTSSLSPVLSMEGRYARFSSLYRLKKAVAWILRLKGKLLKRTVNNCPLTVDELSFAQISIIKAIQSEFFPEMSLLNTQRKGNQKLSGPLQKLNPIYVSGVLRVGANSHVTKLLIEQYHRDIAHCGMSFTWTSLLQKFWVLREAVTVRKVLGQCLCANVETLLLANSLWQIYQEVVSHLLIRPFISQA